MKCKQQVDKNEFHMNTINKDFLNDNCIKCDKNTYEDIHQFMHNIKKEMGGKCVHCNETNLLVLEFDHLYDKKYNISNIHSKLKIEEEAKKCQLLCVHCHNLKSFKDSRALLKTENISSNTKLRRMNNKLVVNIKLNIGCCQNVECNRIITDTNHMGFHFDHLDPSKKLNGISYLINGTCSSEITILTEIEKCQLLCANCHRLRTLEQFNMNQYLI